MNDDAETQRIIGQLQSSVENLQSDVRTLRREMRELIEIAATAKGGWKTLLAVGMTAASVSAAITSAINWIRH